MKTTATDTHRSRALLPFLPGLRVVFASLLALTGMMCQALAAAPLSLKDISYTTLPGEKVQIQLTLSGPAREPTSFTIDNPARIALDLRETQLAVEKKQQDIGVGVVRGLRAVEAGGRTRLVISLIRSAPFETKVLDNSIYITIDGGGRQRAAAVARATAPVENAPDVPTTSNSLQAVDFRRGEKGQGRVTVRMSNPSAAIDMQEKAGQIVVDFLGTSLPGKLERRLDVVDFATPVGMIDTFARDNNVRMVIKATGEYQHLAYQTGDTLVIEVQPPPKDEAARRAKTEFSGEKLSLNFQNIEVRAVLQLLADFTEMNVVVSDSVNGNITLRLKNVPWDQALDIILKSKGLGMRKTNNVVLVAPTEEIAAREKLELEAQQQLEKLLPLRTEYFQINYAKAADIAGLLKAQGNSLLSERGNVTLDARTNTLMILDTQDKLEEIQKLIEKLDIPISQVLIESRIVIANDDFSKDLGARFGVTHVAENGANGLVTTTGTTSGTDTIVNSGLSNLQSSGQPFPVDLPSADDRLNVNLPVVGPAGQLAIAILGSDYLVDLELSALQMEGQGEVISNPRVITSNQKQAFIEQGVEIPYQQATSSGATSVAFKKAVLSLGVTPQITPDDRVIMDLQVTKDSVGEVFNGIPTINTREVNTQVLVDNGDTVVLGGIYEQTRSNQVSKVPLLGDIPLLGALFRSTSVVDDKAELLIFITPKILKEGLQAQ